jgi:glycosyl transferase family 25
MKVFVINLDRHPERRALMATGLMRIGVEHSFFTGVDALRQPALTTGYDEAGAMRHFGAKLMPGEIGAFASHFLLWRRCVDIGEPLTIVEDDVLLSDAFPDVLALADARISRYRLIRLSGIANRRFRVIEEIGNERRLIRYLRGPLGTQCYSLSPDGAAALLSGAQRWVEPVDHFIDRFWRHGVESNAIIPFEAREMDRTPMPSTIGRRVVGRTGVAKFRREANRLRDQAARLWYNLAHR